MPSAPAASPSRARPRFGGPCRAGSPCRTSLRSPGRLNSRAGGHGVGDPEDGDGLAADGAAVGDPRGAGEVLAGVAEGLTVGDGRGDLVGRGEVDVRAGAVDDDEEEEEVVPGRVVSADAGRGTGRTRM